MSDDGGSREDRDSIRATARRIWEELIPNRDVDALPAVMHADSVDHSARPGEPHGIEGLIGTMNWLHSVFSDLAFEIEHVLADGDLVAVHCTMKGRHTGPLMGLAPTGRQVATPMVHVLRFRDGKAAEHWAVHDDLATMRQLGALPPLPAPQPSVTA